MKRLIFFVFIVLCALCAGVQTFIPSVSNAVGSFGLFVTPKAHESIVEKDTIRFVGDVMLARNVESLMRTYGFWYPFALLPKLSDTSYLVGNFEAAIPKEHITTPMLTFAFSVNPTYASLLHQYGFTHLSVANNHSFDFGSGDFENTLNVLSLASTTPFGNPKAQASSTVAVLEVNGLRVALIGLFSVDVLPTTQEIATLQKKAEALSDVQVAYVHWGTEYKTTHTAFQQKLARELIDGGVDVVIGHHPHVVEDIQVYKQKLIFYSLGNFIFDQYFSDEVQQGLMVDMVPHGEKLTFSLLPVTSIDSHSAPRPMNERERATFFKKLAQNSDISLATMIRSGSLTVQK